MSPCSSFLAKPAPNQLKCANCENAKVSHRKPSIPTEPTKKSPSSTSGIQHNHFQHK